MRTPTPDPVDRVTAVLRSLEAKKVTSLIRLDADAAIPHVDCTSTGVLSIDLALGVGGYAWGRIVEIFGPESSGKTTLTLHAIASFQRAGGVCAFIDAEHALDLHYAEALGVKVSDLLVNQPDCGEEALELVCSLTEVMQKGDLIVVDSVAALTPRAEMDGEIGDSHMGLQARMMSQSLRMLSSGVSKSGVVVIFINQIRQKIGVTYGSNETTTGGNALKFYASQRLDIRKIGNIKKGDDVIGGKVRVKVVKNKLAPPYREVETDIRFGQGIPHALDVIIFSSDKGYIEKAGSWLKFEGESIGQGVENAVEYFVQNPEKLAVLEAKIRNDFGVTK